MKEKLSSLATNAKQHPRKKVMVCNSTNMQTVNATVDQLQTIVKYILHTFLHFLCQNSARIPS